MMMGVQRGWLFIIIILFNHRVLSLLYLAFSWISDGRRGGVFALACVPNSISTCSLSLSVLLFIPVLVRIPC